MAVETFSTSKPVYKEVVDATTGEVTKVLNEELSRQISFEYNFGDNIEDAVALFGAEVVFSQYVDGAILDVQAPVRRMLAAKNEDGTNKFSDEQIKDFVAGWVPGVKAVRSKDPMAKIKGILSKLTDEQKEKIKAGGLEELMAALG